MDKQIDKLGGKSVDNDKKHVIPRERYRRRRRVFTEDGQQPMKPYAPAANSGDNNDREGIRPDSKEDNVKKSAAETRREYIEEENGRSHDPVYGYEDLDIDEEQPDDGYQDVYTSGHSKSGSREEEESAGEAQADEVLRAEEPIEERPENKNLSRDFEAGRETEPAQRETPGPSDRPAHQEEPERPTADMPEEAPEDDTPKSGIFGGAAAATAAGAAYKYPGDKDKDTDTSAEDRVPAVERESMKRIQRDKKGRVVKGAPESSDNKNNFYGTVPPAGGGSGNGNNNGGNRGRKGGNGGGFFRSFIIPLVAGILGALLVLLLFNVFSEGDEQEQTATDEQEAGTAEEAEDPAVGDASESETTEAIESSRDSVVSVINLQRIDSLLPGIFGEDAETQQQEPEEAGIGSGVIYKTEGDTSYIVTNYHVVEGAEELQINMQNGESVTANVVGTDIWTDLAVLTIPSEQVEGTLDFADSSELTVGQTAIAIGSPLGEAFSGSVSQGIVSGLDRSVPVDLDGDGSYDWEANVIQTDAAINPGNSGGALIDSNGNLIGINSMKISMPQVEGIGFAIPANEVQQVVSQIEENGEVERPFLGVTLQDLYTIPPEVLQSEMNLPEDVNSGVVISSVQPGSPAENVGLQQLDLITALDGNEVANMMELRQYLYYEKQPGDEMTVEFYRGGEQQTVTVTLQ